MKKIFLKLSDRVENALFRLGLRRTFVMILTLIFTLVYVLLALGARYFIQRIELQTWQGHHQEVAANASQTIAAFIQRANDFLGLLAFFPAEELAHNPVLLSEIMHENPSIIELVRLDFTGNVVASANQGEPELIDLLTIPQAAWFFQAQAGNTYYSDLLITARNEPYMIISRPAAEGGVVVMRLDMKILWAVVDEIQFGRSGMAYVINRQGQLLAHPDLQLVLEHTNLRDRPEYALMMQALNWEWFGNYVNFQGRPVVGYTTRVAVTNWIIFTEVDRGEAVRDSQFILILTGLVILLVMLLANVLGMSMLTRLVFTPIDRLRAATERISQGDFSVRVGQQRVDEIGQVATAFDYMSESLLAQQAALIYQAKRLEKEVQERSRVEEELHASQELLESRVEQRTHDLYHANRELEVEIEERRRMEAVLRESEERIKASLAEKEVLLREIHHRVKNNMQVIISLLNLSLRKVIDEPARRTMLESQHRIRSMALIHEKLYGSRDLARINMAEYIQGLTGFLNRAYASEGSQVRTKLEIGAVYLGIDQAVPCGLIINELYSNALKHAFPEGCNGVVTIRFGLVDGDHYRLEVRDDGVGLPENWAPERGDTLGVQIVTALVTQLNGTWRFETSAGACFEVCFAVL